MNEYRNKIVVITGGGGGIGSAVAEEYLKLGAIVYIIGRTPEKLKKTAERLSCISPYISYICSDISNEEEVERTIEHIFEREKRIDILINSAGIYIEKPTLKMTVSEWDNIMDVNLRGTFLMCKGALPHLCTSKGVVVNVSSDAGMVGFKGVAAYCASKGGINMLTKALAAEFSEYGVRVNAVCPDMVDTDMLQKDFETSGFKMRKEYDEFNWSNFAQGGVTPRYITPEEVANAVLFLSSPKTVPITGVCLAVDFGLTSCM